MVYAVDVLLVRLTAAFLESKFGWMCSCAGAAKKPGIFITIVNGAFIMPVIESAQKWATFVTFEEKAVAIGDCLPTADCLQQNLSFVPACL